LKRFHPSHFNFAPVYQIQDLIEVSIVSLRFSVLMMIIFDSLARTPRSGPMRIFAMKLPPFAISSPTLSPIVAFAVFVFTSSHIILFKDDAFVVWNDRHALGN